MPWFWFILMLFTLGEGSWTDSVYPFAPYLRELVKNEANLLVLLGPVMGAVLLAKSWMFYIGRYVETGELSQASATSMWNLGLYGGTLFGALGLAFLEPLAGVTHQVLQAKTYSETVAALIAMTPLVLFALMMDSLAYQWEQYSRQVSPEATQSPLEKPLTFLWQKAQLSWLLPVIPMLISCLGVDALKLAVSEDLLQRWSILFVPILALMVAVVVGSLLLSLWTESLVAHCPQGPHWIQLFREVGVPVRDIRLWRTGGRINNALLLSFLPGWRYVLLTDKLLATLTPRELEMVLLHEAAHCKYRHSLKRFFALSLGLAAVMAAFSFGSWVGIVASLVVGAGVVRGVQWIWHHTELEADRMACELSFHLQSKRDREGESTEQQLWNRRRHLWKSAMELSTALYNLVGNQQRAERDTWTHPSVKSRVQTLADIFTLGNP